MTDYFDEEDEDAKADELPSDEEGDAMTGNNNNNNNNNQSLSQPQPNPNRKPKTPPPVLDNFAMNMNMNDPVQLQQELSKPQSPQSLYAADSFSPRSQNSATSPRLFMNDNIMAFNPDSIKQRQSKHIPSKTMPVQLPQFWTCQMCTFAENSIDSPVCGVCGALPPMDNNKKKKKKKKKDNKPIPVPKIPTYNNNNNNNNPISPRAYQPSHHQHQEWQQQQTRARHNNHEMNHLRTVSEQIPNKSFQISQNMLPNFLEEEDEKDSQQPS